MGGTWTGWRGFATGGAKKLFRFGPAGSERICITEAAIDAMSLAAIEGLRPDSFMSAPWRRTPATDEAIRDLAKRANAWLVAATDNNRQGDVYADRVLPSPRKRARGMRGCDRAPMIGTRI